MIYPATFHVDYRAGPCNEHAVRAEYTFGFRVEALQVKPMQSRRDRDQRHRFIRQFTVLSGRNSILHVGMRFSRCDLLLTRIHRDDACKTRGEIDGGLTVSAPTIPDK